MLIPQAIVQQGSSGGGDVTLLDSEVLAGTAASVVLTVGGGTYTNLLLEWYARGDNAGNPTVRYQLNGDTGTNYDQNLLVSVNNAVAGAATGGQTSGYLGDMPGSGGSANYFASGSMRVAHFQGTVGFKSVVASVSCIRGSAASDYVTVQIAGLWHSTAAITSVTVLASANNFIADSSFSLYGLT